MGSLGLYQFLCICAKEEQEILLSSDLIIINVDLQRTVNLANLFVFARENL